jgi:hypothetical protein
MTSTGATMKHRSITIPALVKELGAEKITEEIGCDRTLPAKWAKGQRPGWSNTEKLVELAKANGYTLEIIRGVK